MPESSELRVIDSSVWIQVLRRGSSYAQLARVEELLETDRAATVPVIRVELLQGAKDEPEYNRLRGRLDLLPTIEVTETVWEQAEKLAFLLRRRGLSPAIGDLLIAAATMSAGAGLVHADSDFDTIARHSRLRVESFVRATAR
ncbi:MAG: type II toxin-antitoxin system VapC family toxin [bacterium]